MNSDQEGIEANSMLAKAKGDPSIAQLFGFLFMKSSGEWKNWFWLENAWRKTLTKDKKWCQKNIIHCIFIYEIS